MEQFNSLKPTNAAGLRTMKRESHPGRIGMFLDPSLSLRFILLRTTAPPTRRPTEKPNRLNPRSFRRDTRTRRSFDQLLLASRMASKSFLLVSRNSLRINRHVSEEVVVNLDGELASSSEHTSFKYVPTSARTHTRSESMNATSAPFLRLISTLRHRYFSNDYTWRSKRVSNAALEDRHYVAVQAFYRASII